MTNDPSTPYGGVRHHGSRHPITDRTRMGQRDLIALEAGEHKRRGTIPMSELRADPELLALLEQVADKLATLGARDPVNELEVRWSADGKPSVVSLRWIR